jgi:hypothetical protein
MKQNQNLIDLLSAYSSSPEPSYKVSNYFHIYNELFQHLRGTECTFVEIGILEGGSLFMWRKWLGDKARIIGIDLNPDALKWNQHGFEIYIGDQGDPAFWQELLPKIGQFDVLLDDGGHQSFQQIVTTTEAIKHANKDCLIVVEDTITSFMKSFSNHGDKSFQKFAYSASDCLLARGQSLWPNDFIPVDNKESVNQFAKVNNIQFYNGMVCFKITPDLIDEKVNLTLNMPLRIGNDFRYNGKNQAIIDWPNPFYKETTIVKGGR